MVSFPVRTEVENSSAEKPGFTVTPLPVTTGDLSTLPMSLPLDSLLSPAQERQGGQEVITEISVSAEMLVCPNTKLQRKNGWWEGHGQDGAQHSSYHLKAGQRRIGGQQLRRKEAVRRTEKEQQKPERTSRACLSQGSVDGESFPRCVKEEKKEDRRRGTQNASRGF